MLAWALAGSAGSQEATPRPAADRLVDELASPDFTVREQAHRALLKLGPAAEDALRRGAESQDVEQRLRVESILRQVNRHKLWEPAHIDFQCQKAPVLDVFRVIAEQSGNPINWDRSAKTITTPVDIDWKNTIYWQAIDEACRKGNVIARQFDDPNRAGAVLNLGDPGACPVAYAGPLRLTLLSARHALSDSLNYGGGVVDRQEHFNLTFALHWEQRLHLCRYVGRPAVIQAVTETGQDLALAGSSKVGSMHISRRQRQLVLPARLRPPDGSPKRLSRLVVELTLEAAGDFRQFEVKTDEPGCRVEYAGYELELIAMESKQAQWELSLRWTRPIPYDKINATDMVDEHLTILDSGGKPLLFNQRRVVGDKISVRYVLQVQKKRGRPAKLRYHVALLHSPRTVRFTYQDVPLP